MQTKGCASVELMVRKEEVLEERVGALAKKVSEGFKGVNERFDRVEGDVRELRGDVKKLDKKIDDQGRAIRTDMNTRSTAVEANLASLQRSLLIAALGIIGTAALVIIQLIITLAG